jgi:hypothetical protein
MGNPHLPDDRGTAFWYALHGVRDQIRPARSLRNEGVQIMRILEILTLATLLLAFFDKHLKGLATPLLDGPSPDYPEVVFMSRHP